MNERRPHRIWYVAHLLFGILTGIAVWLLWKDENRAAARMHLIHSIWMPIVVWGILFGIGILLGTYLEPEGFEEFS